MTVRTQQPPLRWTRTRRWKLPLLPATPESSGGLTLAVAREYAETGVEMLAVGELTHSVTVFDIGLDDIGSDDIGLDTVG